MTSGEPLEGSRFDAVLNERGIPTAEIIPLPESVRTTILPVGSLLQREHPDIRLARRARTIADLARVISERRVTTGIRRTLLVPDSCDRRRWLSPGVTTGIRRTLLVQVQRLEFLARNRLDELEANG